DHDFAKYIERRVLRDKLSPCAVLGEIKRRQLFSTDISKPTLYRYIEMGYIGGLSMQDLPMGKRKKRYRRAVAKRPPKGTSIEKRPQEVASRQTFGHWEMDTLCGSTRATFLVLSERLTRNEFILPMPNLKAESVIRCLNILERRFGRRFRNVFKSITIDNGSEFSDFHGLEKSIYRGKRTSVFYCHPYCSSERGTNERLNREIRRHIPKGSDLSKYSAEDIKSVENWVNNYPREIFGYATSQELFEQHLRAVF
ncbi:MAG: IS30 family transposase, partial [Firmicutes bacterium]|nr:IS30 family transposase [Bacillota bacterium]